MVPDCLIQVFSTTRINLIFVSYLETLELCYTTVYLCASVSGMHYNWRLESPALAVGKFHASIHTGI